MKIDQAFPSRYLRPPDLGGRQPIVTVDRVVTERVAGQPRRAVCFRGKTKLLLLNKTNWRAFMEITRQDDDDQWAGARVRLVVTSVAFQGREVPAIRVEAAPPPGPPAGHSAAVPTMPAASEVPF